MHANNLAQKHGKTRARDRLTSAGTFLVLKFVCSVSVESRTIFMPIANYTSIIALYETRYYKRYLSGYFLISSP
jgi:hypothetical protein